MKTKPAPKKKPAAAAPKPIAEGKRQAIDTKLIDPHPHNRKIDPASVKGLAASMKAYGQVQPAVVRPHPDKKGRFQLGAGGRRFLAAKINGQPLDCIVRDLSDREIEAMLAVENLQREAPEPREEAAQIRRLFQLPDATPQAVAATLGKDDAWVKRRMRLLDLIDPVHDLWQEPDSDIHHLPVSTMELVAQLTPEQQMAIKEELFEDNYDTPTTQDVVGWISSMGCSLKDVKWLENPATFIKGCGPGCASSSAAADLFSQTEFADKKQLKCAQCMNPACFNKRKDLARAHAWQTVISRAPKGFIAITDRYQKDHRTIQLPDQSTITARESWDYNGWKACKKSDPAAKPFIVEKGDSVSLTWKTPPKNATTADTAGTTSASTVNSAASTVKTPEESRQASIDRLQAKRYDLVLKELREHVDKAILPTFDNTALALASLATAFGTTHTLSEAGAAYYAYRHEEEKAARPGEDVDDDLDEDDETTPSATAASPAWEKFRQGLASPQDGGFMLVNLWKGIRAVLAARLRTRSFTDRKSDIIKPMFMTEMREVAALTGFDMEAAYLRAAAACKPPGTLKDLDPVTLVKKS